MTFEQKVRRLAEYEVHIRQQYLETVKYFEISKETVPGYEFHPSFTFGYQAAEALAAAEYRLRCAQDAERADGVCELGKGG